MARTLVSARTGSQVGSTLRSMSVVTWCWKACSNAVIARSFSPRNNQNAAVSNVGSFLSSDGVSSRSASSRLPMEAWKLPRMTRGSGSESGRATNVSSLLSSL